MWIFLYFCLALSFSNILQVKSQSPKYTFEVYNKGNIQEDAFSASDDPDNPIYIGMDTVNNENVTGSLFPLAKELTIESKDKIYKIKTCLKTVKILLIEDPSKCKWMYRATKGQRSNMWNDFKKEGVSPVTIGTSQHRQKTTTMVGRTKTDDGTVVVGRVNYGIFYGVNNDSKVKKYEDYDILVCEKDKK